ncbi:hypothetical protein H5U35_01780 [Candidatus Aerophobetes bacterium]|nr:hypothetical protein [Candidatus Aerophobetes bacterium]
MYLFIIVYEEVLESEVSAMLEEIEPERYIRVEKVKGKWKEKHMGNHIWPGVYQVVCVMSDGEKKVLLDKKIKDIRHRFPADEIWGWVINLEKVI